jgi:hypothetical protein
MAAESYSSTSNDLGSDVQSATQDLGMAAGEQLDKGRSAAAGGIASAAASLHGHAEELPGGQRVAGFAHSAADKLNLTANYIRDHDVSAMVEDVKALVKKNPVPALLGAAAIGFLVAKSFSNRD